MLQRIINVIKLDINTIEEIERDESATTEAAIVVVLVAILGAIGAYVGAQAGNAVLDQFQEQFGQMDVPMADFTLSPVGALVSTLVGVLVGWVIWSALTYFIGTSLFGADATMGEMLRVIGYAHAPRLLTVFSFIPCLGALISLAASIWGLVVSFVAIRQGLDLDNVKTFLTIVVSWIVAVIINWLVIGPLVGLIV